jgi:outer membrane protein OmpA-like peptidoglycan-associated protein
MEEKMRKTFAVAVMFVFLFTSYAAYSQTWDQAKGLGLTGSIFKFLGGDVDRAAPGLSGGLSLRYGFNPYLMLDLNANYGSFQPTEDGEAFKVESNSPYQTFLMPITLDVKLTPAPESHFKPYFYIGGGVLLWDLRNVSGTDKSFLKDLELRWGDSVYGRTKREAIYKTGLGLETFLTNGLALDLQAGILGLANSNPSDNVGYFDNNDYAVTGRGTLSFYFGYYKDTDKDGIEDKKDADPLRPEDFDSFQDEDGAPDDDNDGDGILDIKDKAPNDPEDKDGFQDDDGIPDLDNDGDGILDANDRDPNGAEDVDGFQDGDGAPDPDNDGDGILDVNDKCPGTDETVAKGLDTKETFNGYQDDDGCPDKKPAPALEKKGAKLILKGVNFETNSDKLTPESFAILDEVIVGLIDNKDVSLEARGYTDDRGSASYNQKLSERRAIAVMEYLVSKGVDKARLTAAGYGKKDPIVSNATPEGRAQNRRIEFVRTK